MTKTKKTCATCKHWHPDAAVRACVSSSDVECGDWAIGDCRWLEETNMPTYGNPIRTHYNFGCTAWESIGDVLDLL